MSAADHAPPPPLKRRSRLDLLDLARGLALLAMFVFHFAYDLSHFGLIETNVPAHPGWSLFARLIAGSFLTIVGVSLVLATRNGLNRRAFLKRLAMVAAAAALVTVGTFLAMPDSFIFFGILHHVALASVLALPFLRWPTPVVVLAAAVSFALPHLIAAEWLDTPWLLWLGLSRYPVVTADYVPVFPWFGCVLAGIVLGRLLLPHLEKLSLWRARTFPANLVAWGGRHSLLVYLVHQPVFIAGLIVAMSLGLGGDREARAFLTTCETSCRQGPDPQSCARLCVCAMAGLKREDLWSRTLANTLSPRETDRAREIGQSCARAP